MGQSSAQQKGKLIIFSAPSGAGKTTIVKHLLQKNFNLEFSISATSRKARNTETHAKDYHFISEKEFHRKVTKLTLLWSEMHAAFKINTCQRLIL